MTYRLDNGYAVTTAPARRDGLIHYTLRNPDGDVVASGALDTETFYALPLV